MRAGLETETAWINVNQVSEAVPHRTACEIHLSCVTLLLKCTLHGGNSSARQPHLSLLSPKGIAQQGARYPAFTQLESEPLPPARIVVAASEGKTHMLRKESIEMVSNGVIGRRLLNVREAAQYLGLEVDTVYKKSRLREVPCVKVGRALRFDVRALERYIEQHTIEIID